MKAIIFLSTISELPCEISSVSDHEVSFKLSKDIATASTLQSCFMLGARMYEYSTEISVSISREHVDLIRFVD